MKNNTIAAISTPIGTGGIAIVRMSGKESLKVLQKLTKYNVNSLTPRMLTLCDIKTKEFKEKALVVYFANPYSYTGEDLVEIQCHGGVVIAEGILNELLENGARLADNGEFTKRAFLNGKLSLESAEGVIDMINAESEAEVRAGYNLLKGELSDRVNSMQNTLTNVMASMEVSMDYPEHEVEEVQMRQYENNLTEVKNMVEELLKTYKTGKLVKSGITVAIVGRPNVGKSSVMNSLLNYNRAIVTNIEGTTRDTLEDSYTYNGVKINLIDTAGIRESEETVEKIGIKKAKEVLNYADIILAVFDGSESLTKQDEENLKLVENKKTIYIVNKTDKPLKLDLKNKQVIFISALKKEGIQTIKQKIYDMVIDKNIINSPVLITNERQKEALRDTLNSLNLSIQSLKLNNPLDLVSIDLSNAWNYLGQITGKTSTEEIIDAIFKNFCLGK